MKYKFAYCPFCGKKRLEILQGWFTQEPFVHCKACGVSVYFPGTPDEESLSKRWNRRVFK
jgi:Lar family restriction alleviation protein